MPAVKNFTVVQGDTIKLRFEHMEKIGNITSNFSLQGCSARMAITLDVGDPGSLVRMDSQNGSGSVGALTLEGNVVIAVLGPVETSTLPMETGSDALETVYQLELQLPTGARHTTFMGSITWLRDLTP